MEYYVRDDKFTVTHKFMGTLINAGIMSPEWLSHVLVTYLIDDYIYRVTGYASHEYVTTADDWI